MAENPVSRTWVQQVFLPLVPGVDSLLEPLQEQAEDAQARRRSRSESPLTCAPRGLDMYVPHPVLPKRIGSV